jgi:hypothetical protein
MMNMFLTESRHDRQQERLSLATWLSTPGEYQDDQAADS